jgi:hypothetical protein
MLPVFGYAAQRVLIEVHMYAALLLVIGMLAHTWISLAARRARGRRT